MARPDRLRRAQPFLGLLLAAAGWAVSHQIGSDTVFDDCSATGVLVPVVASVIGALIAVGGAFVCLGARRGGGGEGYRFFATVGALLALMVGFAIVLQLAASLILPPCAA